MDTREDNEQKKAYLRQFRAKLQAVNDMELEIERIRTEKMYPAAVIGDDMPHAHNQADLSDYAVALEAAEQMLIKARYDNIMCYTDIMRRIEDMEDETEKRVLRLRYITGMSWEKIAVEMDYSWTGMHKLHSRALKNF